MTRPGSALHRLLGAAIVFALIAGACAGDGSSDTTDRQSVSDEVTVASTEPQDGAEPTGVATTPESPPPVSESGAETTTTTVTPTSALPPASISVTVEEGAAVTQRIGIAGGTLSVSSADGTTFTLVVPEQALFDDVDITMTPLAGADGDAIGDSRVAGVRLEPDGLQFLGAATLEIVGGAVPPGAVGFSAEANGDGFHLVPTGVSDAGTMTVPAVPTGVSDAGIATVLVAHFSVHGIGERQLAELASEHRPEGAPDQVSQLVAVASALGVDDTQQLRQRMQFLAPLLLGWIDTVVGRLSQDLNLDRLEASAVDLRDIGMASLTFLYLALSLEMDEVRDQINERLVRMYALWNTRVSELVERLSESCASGDIEAGFDIARWWTIGVHLNDFNGQPLSPLPDPGFSIDVWVERAASCFTFDARWNADVVNVGDGVRTPFAADVSSTLPDRSTIDAATWVESLLREGRDSVSAPSALSVTDGPFGPCDGVAGGAGLELQIDTDIPNLGDVGGATITGMAGVVGLTVPIEVVCPQLAGLPAPVADVFFVNPLAIANESWSSDLAGYSTAYRFPLEIGPHPDGSIARFDHQAEMGGSPSSFSVLQEFTLKRAA